MSHPRTGAEALHSLKPDLNTLDIVNSSAKLAERKGEKGATTNAARKIGVYLGRLDKLTETEGGRHRLIDHITDELIVKSEDIPEAYWRQQEQLARDNGQNIYLDDLHKEVLVDQLQGAQRTGLESWTNYLDQTGDQYPIWFKAYALDGMANLATFNKQKGFYNKRSKGTVAPYPQLEPAALAQTYDAVKMFHSDQQSLGDKATEELVRGGNFNKIYSRFLLDNKAIIATPENVEDVYGEWKEYTKDDIEAITNAAQGTPWCIAGEDMARRYTRNDDDAFYLFHLQDPETGRQSPTAAASVRMENGRVAEISGLKGGASQYLEDSLVPEVMHKVKTLDGGEDYLEAFEDKQTLIAMDRKFQAGEDFSIVELRFLYELDRKIVYIDTYAHDPRPDEFKHSRDYHEQQFASEYGDVDAAWMVMSLGEVRDGLDYLLRKGANVDRLSVRLEPQDIIDNFPSLLEAGARIDFDALFAKSPELAHVNTVSKLLEAGVSLDSLIQHFSREEITGGLSWLLVDDTYIGIDELVGKLDALTIEQTLPWLIAAGVSEQTLERKLGYVPVIDDIHSRR